MQIPIPKTISKKSSKQPLSQDAFARICKALGHPARIKILMHLKEIKSCICNDIVAVLPLSQSTVSQHLKILKQAGLVQGEIEGPRTCYCVNLEKLQQFKNSCRIL